MDFLLQCPHAKLGDVALHFGYTQSWLSTVIHSNAFQAELASRRGEISTRIAGDIPTRLRALGHQAIEKLEDTFEVGLATPSLAMEVLQLAAKAEGLGEKKPAANQPTIMQIFNGVTPDMLSNARERMVSLRVTQPDVVDIDVGDSSSTTIPQLENHAG